MSTPNIYPFTIYASDVHYVSNPKLAEYLWMRDRKAVAPNLTWYGLDLEVLAANRVEIHVREMANSFSGGIGPRIFSYSPELTDKERAELHRLIVERQTRYAEYEFSRRRAQREIDEVEAIRRELFEPA